MKINSNISHSASSATGKNSLAFGENAKAIGENSYAQGQNVISGQEALAAIVPTDYALNADGNNEFTVPIEFANKLTVGEFIKFYRSGRPNLTYFFEVLSINGNIIKLHTKDVFPGGINLIPDTLERLVSKNTHAEGLNTKAIGNVSHAEGQESRAIGENTHVEGFKNTAFGLNSHAEGQESTTSGIASHAEGSKTSASGYASHAEGLETNAWGWHSHAEGEKTRASGTNSHAEGKDTVAFGIASHAEGSDSQAWGYASHAEGASNMARTSNAHAEGTCSTAANGDVYSIVSVDVNAKKITIDRPLAGGLLVGQVLCHARGGRAQFYYTNSIDATGTVIGVRSADYPELPINPNSTHLIKLNDVINDTSHAEGFNTLATGINSHAEGDSTIASGIASHAEGSATKASASNSHAEGEATTASGYCSHAEGLSTTASGHASHAEGEYTTASATYSHAEGFNNTASGDASHVEGELNIASGYASHAEGYGNISASMSSHAEGSYNLSAYGDLFKIISVDSFNKTFILNSVTNLVVGSKVICFINGKNQGKYYEITAIDNLSNIITVKNLQTTGIGSVHPDSAYLILLKDELLPNPTHAEGYNTISSGYASHASGTNTVASHDSSFVIGKYGESPAVGSFALANGISALNKGLATKIQNDGKVFSDGAYASTGADYAEMFEWADGNTQSQDRVGYFVTFDTTQTDKIRIAKSTDTYILGVISASPAIVGDNMDMNWKGRWMEDEWGRKQYDADGKLIPNPEWNTDQNYIPREDRKEWDAVGLVGKLRVRDDGTCVAGQMCKPNDQGIATLSTDGQGYRVMARINPNQVLIMLK